MKTCGERGEAGAVILAVRCLCHPVCPLWPASHARQAPSDRTEAKSAESRGTGVCRGAGLSEARRQSPGPALEGDSDSEAPRSVAVGREGARGDGPREPVVEGVKALLSKPVLVAATGHRSQWLTNKSSSVLRPEAQSPARRCWQVGVWWCPTEARRLSDPGTWSLVKDAGSPQHWAQGSPLGGWGQTRP